MFLKNITLEEFRGLNLRLSFIDTEQKSRLMTVLLGQNGVGKSNFLKSIALLTCGSDALPELLGEVDDWITTGKSECSVRGVILSSDGREISLSLTLKRGQRLKDVIVSNIDSLNIVDQILYSTSRKGFVLAYGAARKLLRVTDVSLTREEERQRYYAGHVASLFSSESKLKPLSQWAMQLEYESDRQRLRVMADFLNDLLPGIRFTHIDKARKDLVFMVGANPVPLSLLGEGHQIAAGLIGDILYQLGRLYKTVSELMGLQGILLVDQIDLQMHPKWQQLLVKYLKAKFPRVQMIFTTHSAIVAQQTDYQGLYYLARTEQGAVELNGFRGDPSEMLIHQMLLSPAFGLSSDESVRVQELKTQYREIKSRKDSLNSADERRLKKLSAELAALPKLHRSGYVAEASQIELINDVRNELINLRKK